MKGRRDERIGVRKLWKEGRKGINQEIKMVGCEEGWKEEMTKGKEKDIGNQISHSKEKILKTKKHCHL